MNQHSEEAAARGGDRLDRALARIAQLSPEYGSGLSDHAPMVVEALDRLGRPDAIAPYLERTVPKRRTLREETASALTAFAEELAQAEALIASEGAAEATRRYALRFGPGLAGAAFHGLLRVAHALEGLSRRDSAERRHELARALAYATLRAEPLPAPANDVELRTPAPLHEVLVGLTPSEAALVPRAGLISTALADRAVQHPTLAIEAARIALPDDVHAAGEALRAEAFALFTASEYLPRATFTLLHAVTGMDAAARVAARLPPPDARALLAHAAHALAAVRIAFVGRFPHPLPRHAERSFTGEVARAVSSLDDHAIKLAAALVDGTQAAPREHAAALALWVDEVV